MRFSVFTTFATVAIAGLASALSSNPITAPLGSAVLTAGQAYTITWNPTDGNIVTLLLREGTDENNLDTVEIIADNLPNNGAFIWVPSPDLKGSTDYAVQIISANPETNNFSPRFKINSNGKGISSTTLMPSTTRVATATAKATGKPKVVSSGAAEATSVDIDSVLAEESAAASGATGAAQPTSSTLVGAAGRVSVGSGNFGMFGLVGGMMLVGAGMVLM